MQKPCGCLRILATNLSLSVEFSSHSDKPFCNLGASFYLAGVGASSSPPCWSRPHFSSSPEDLPQPIWLLLAVGVTASFRPPLIFCEVSLNGNKAWKESSCLYSDVMWKASAPFERKLYFSPKKIHSPVLCYSNLACGAGIPGGVSFFALRKHGFLLCKTDNS